MFVLYAETGSLQGALERALELLDKCSAEYEVCTARLYRAYEGELDVLEALEKLVTGCRYMCTGNLAWSLATTRYGVVAQPNGRVMISL
ncbi:hypothetical protein LTR86_005420 [Recurvomyces mirabilis]|nr:hypothetical protein LTR86_005420 [Recurvomyces mirabilis]